MNDLHKPIGDVNVELEMLQGLILAYRAAPSAELAKIIVFGYLDRDDVEAGLAYLKDLSRPLQNTDAARLVKMLIQKKHAQLAIPVLDRGIPEQALLMVRCMLETEQVSAAGELYRDTIEKHPELQQPDLDEHFQYAARNEVNEKPKLRVVEKIDMATVVDLTRYKAPVTDFSDVVGLSDIKKQIHKKIILPFQKPSLFQRFKKRVGGGILLYGPPGCGKTLLARATAGECKASFFNIQISDVLDMYIGESEQKLHAIFEKARAGKPAVLFFDELEALAGKREHTRNASSSNTVSQFLAELDGFTQNNEGVLILASTNVPWAIDTAFLRPGRFDRMFFVPPPDREAREAILRHHMHERPAGADIDYALMAKRTPGYSGADLANLVDMAADEAIDESIASGNSLDIQSRHFKLAVDDSRATTNEWLTTARNYARYSNDGGRYDDVLEFLKKHGQ